MPRPRRRPKKTVLDIARKNPALYKKLRGIYADRYIGELLDENGKLRADAEEYLTEEMAADLIGYTLSDPEILANLTGEQRNVLQKFVDKLVSKFGDKNLKAASEYLSNADADIRAIFKDVAKEADVIAEQFKAALDTSKKAEKNTVERDGVRSSKDINDDFSYKKLISKPDMKITLLKPVEKSTINKYQNDKTLFAKEMKHKATVDGKHPLNTDTQTWLFNKDTQSDILVGKDSFKHGTTRGIDATYIEVCQNLSDILYNAVAVNSLKPRENTNGGTVYLSIAENADNYVVVRFAVEKRTQKLLDYEVLSAITKNSIKKEDAGVKAPRLPIGTNAKKGSATSSTISIADFLDVVKDYYSDVLSNDVLKHFEIERKHSALSDSVKHSKELFTDDRTMSAEEIENVFKSSRKVTLNFSSAVDKWLSGKKKKTGV